MCARHSSDKPHCLTRLVQSIDIGVAKFEETRSKFQVSAIRWRKLFLCKHERNCTIYVPRTSLFKDSTKSQQILNHRSLLNIAMANYKCLPVHAQYRYTIITIIFPLIWLRQTAQPYKHTVYSIQQSATQGSNDTAHTMSRKTATTTRGGRLPGTDGIKIHSQGCTYGSMPHSFWERVEIADWLFLLKGS